MLIKNKCISFFNLAKNYYRPIVGDKAFCPHTSGVRNKHVMVIFLPSPAVLTDCIMP